MAKQNSAALVLLFIGILSCANLCCMDNSSDLQTPDQQAIPKVHGAQSKPLVIILTSNGGGGHMSATTAIIDYLKDQFTVEQKFVLEDSLPLQSIGVSGEQTYNAVVRRIQNCTILNGIFWAGYGWFKWNAPRIDAALRTYLQEKKPCLVISVVPLINSIACRVTADLNIPFLLSPTDIDVYTFLLDVDGAHHPCFRFNAMFQDAQIEKSVQLASIAPRSIYHIGFPLRSDFYEPKDIQALAQERKIDLSKPVLLLLMGSQGSQTIIEYVRRLTEVPIPFHLIVCIGHNESLRPEIEKVAHFKEASTYTIQGMTPRMSDLMALASLFITKSGTASVCESIQMRLPMLLDATVPLIKWEQYNHEFVDRHKLGVSIKEFDLIAPIVTSMLHTDTYRTFKQNFEPFVQHDTPDRMRELAQSMFIRHTMPAKL